MPEITRRQLFRLRLGDFTREIGKAAAGEGDAGTGEEPFLRPPGALPDEDAFLGACERCHACADACPHGVVRQFGAAFGKLEGTPFIDPATIPCRWCEDMPCIEACPSGALRRDAGGAVPPIAKVALHLDACLTSQGVLCDTCAYRCPGKIRAIRMVNRRPVLDPDSCTGCGMCLFYCDAEPTAFEIVFAEAGRVPDGHEGVS